jgi:anti-sigma-K factor RskA
MSRNTDELRDLLLLYAVDQVDEQERREIEEWIASGDPAAAAALAEARATVGQLPTILEPVEPSAQMWSRLESQLDEASEPAKASIPMPTQQRPIWPWLAMAAMVAVASSVGTYLVVKSGADRDRQELAQLREQFAGQERRLGEQSREIEVLNQQVGQANRAMMLVSAPRLQSVAVGGTDKMPDAAGRLLWDADGRVLSFTASRLASLKPDQTYELWFVTDPGGPVSLGTFRLDESGRGQVFVNAPAQLASIKAVAVSLEPATGSPGPGPTGPVVMLGTLN